VSLLGRTDIALLIALVTGAILLWRGRAEGLAALLIPVVLAADNLVKTLVARPRPPAGAGHSVELLPQLLAKSTETFAFPSSHVALVAFLAVVLGAALPKWRPLFWALVVLVALTRIYLNKHWFTDVVAGALLGVLLAELSLLLVTRVADAWTARRRPRVAV
jgi:undecaprenyl-diphosphatase